MPDLKLWLRPAPLPRAPARHLAAVALGVALIGGCARDPLDVLSFMNRRAAGLVEVDGDSLHAARAEKRAKFARALDRRLRIVGTRDYLLSDDQWVAPLFHELRRVMPDEVRQGIPQCVEPLGLLDQDLRSYTNPFVVDGRCHLIVAAYGSEAFDQTPRRLFSLYEVVESK